MRMINTITAQVWMAMSVLGIAISAITGEWIIAGICPWIGLFLGVAVNEILPDAWNEGVRILR